MEKIIEEKLINSMMKVHTLLKKSFINKRKASFKVEVPQFKYSELLYQNEIKLAFECLKWNYRELLRYLRKENYTPSLKIVLLYEHEKSFPVVLNMTLPEFLESDLFVGKEILNIKNV
ncbi:hypothetical protein [Fusobacterium sp.]|uniref:hypothetical protein n=1 Tax=Fusobacterium sp. TaxID=68766 RepID=UPI002902BCBB|nr:hypothetical protein [Fusobacterium sp.]MDU1912080.1 hypothetical protein [Fusobacterium sp.]